MAKRTKKLIENQQTTEEVRLNKYLSDAGVCSRRQADKYIEEGAVTIDGVTAVMGSKVKEGQVVLLNGKPVKKDEQLVLIAFNKPTGIVSTTDLREKDNIISYINYGKRIYPIGRLDKDSEGLILLTNDGNIVNKILRAGNNHEKEYIVTVNKTITSEFLKGMATGVPILDTVTRPCKIEALDKNTFNIILTQGLNRQIRRMCEYFGYNVLTLKRIRIMNVNLGHLQVGGYRNVTEKEIAGLNELIRNSANNPSTIENKSKTIENKTRNTDNRPRTEKNKTRNTDNRPRTAENKTRNTDNRPRTAENKTRNTDNRPRTAENKTRNTDNRPRTAENKTRNTENKPRTENKYRKVENKPRSIDNQKKTEQNKSFTSKEDGIKTNHTHLNKSNQNKSNQNKSNQNKFELGQTRTRQINAGKNVQDKKNNKR